ncbi:MAG TPA: hypothetical protein VMF53_11060, partial [Alphaproteobacteria bacterium]|nr:hypothetical protein [Alphaproteobacteria bacterium]
MLNRSTDGGGHEFFAPRAEAVLARLLQAAYGKPVDGQALWRRLERVAAALNRGDRPLAAILLVQAEIEALPDEAAAQRLAKADLELRARCGVAARGPTKAGFDPDEPRLPAGQSGGGQWTDGDGGGTDSSDDERGGPRDPNIQPAAAIVSDIQARKEAFVDAHLADAQKAADKLGVPVENIL